MSLRSRLRRLRQEAEKGVVLVRQRDGTVRTFDVMQVQAEMFLASLNLFRETSVNSEVLEAVRNATPETRRVFEERFGPITMSGHVISGEEGWVEAYVLAEDGEVQVIRYEGGSAEAERIRREARHGGPGF